jgi:hypothetical protein
MAPEVKGLGGDKGLEASRDLSHLVSFALESRRWLIAGGLCLLSGFIGFELGAAPRHDSRIFQDQRPIPVCKADTLRVVSRRDARFDVQMCGFDGMTWSVIPQPPFASRDDAEAMAQRVRQRKDEDAAYAADAASQDGEPSSAKPRD